MGQRQSGLRSSYQSHLTFILLFMSCVGKRGHKVVVRCDNSGAEVISYFHPSRKHVRHVLTPQLSIRRGTARAWDHAQLVHRQWMRAAVLNIAVRVMRVAIDGNIADLPSRKVHPFLFQPRMHP